MLQKGRVLTSLGGGGRGLNLCSANLAGCSLGSGEPLWASESPWIQRLFPASVCCPLFCKQHNRACPPQHPHLCPLDLGYLFLVTSLRIPGGVASRTWMGLVSLAGSSPPFPAQDRSWRVRNCRSPLPSPSPPLPAATEPLTFFTPLPRNPKLMGPRIGVSLSLKGQNYSWGTGETSVPGYS